MKLSMEFNRYKEEIVIDGDRDKKLLNLNQANFKNKFKIFKLPLNITE